MSEKIIVYSTVWCADCKRTKKFFGEHRVQYENIDIEQNPEHVDFVMQVNNGMRIVPTIVFPDGSTLSEPNNAQLAEKLGLRTKAERSFYDVIVIGGGPAGAIAALVLARAGVRVRVLDRARFPRFKLCGDSVNPGALAILTGAKALVIPMPR
mgnify:CR=1 FL=1